MSLLVADNRDYIKDVREREKNNILLVRPVLGQTRRTTRDLPSAGKSYGRPNEVAEIGTFEVVQNWQFHNNPSDRRAEFERTKDQKRHPPVAKNFTYGKRTPDEGSTIGSLLANNYQRKWVEEVQAAKADSPTKGKNKMVDPKPTKASQGHTQQRGALESPKEPFKMKKFANVPSRLSSQRR